MKPRATTVAFVICAVLCGAFAATGPWTFGSLTLRYWQPLFALCLLIVAPTLVSLTKREVEFSAAAIWTSLAVIALVLLRMCVLRYQAFEVNAWDFSNSFDRPIEQTLHGRLLWSDTIGSSMLAQHCNWLSLAFVPLYALHASPYWLIIAQPLAVVAAAAILFRYARLVAADDVVAACVALAFLVNRYTIRALNEGFVIDIFYPAGIFLLIYAFTRRNWLLGILALALVLSIKEDAVLTLIGFALVAGVFHRRWRWAAATLAFALTVFAFDYFVVRASYPGIAVPFAHYWGSFGATPGAALAGMLRHPIEVLRRAGPPAFFLFGSMAFLPLIGGAWTIAALPTIILYTSADTEDLHWLALHYSLPFIGLLFASLPAAIDRLASRTTLPRRTVAVALLLVSAFVGTGYKMERSRSEHLWVRGLVDRAGERPVYVEGALFPHAGYESRVRVLHHTITPPPNSAYLVCATCKPYPFSREELESRIASLRSNAAYTQIRAGDLWLFVPR